MPLANLDLLRPIHLFAGLDDDALRALAHELDETHVLAGQYIFAAGSPGDKMYIVARGSVELFLQNPPDEQVEAGIAHPGALFGEQAFLSGQPRAFNAKALEDTVVIAIDQPALETLITAHPTAALAMLATLSQPRREADRSAPTIRLPALTVETATFGEKLADFTTGVIGDLRFIGVYVLWIIVWIGLNVNLLPGLPAFDPYPFHLLTLIMSIEIMLMLFFVLINQNRQAARAKTQAEIRSLTQQLEEFQRTTLTHFSVLERRLDRR